MHQQSVVTHPFYGVALRSIFDGHEDFSTRYTKRIHFFFLFNGKLSTTGVHHHIHHKRITVTELTDTGSNRIGDGDGIVGIMCDDIVNGGFLWFSSTRFKSINI